MGSGTPSAFGSSPCKRLMHNSPSPPLRGRCRRQRGGSLPVGPIWSSPAAPPLSLRDISPRKGGRGESEDMHHSLQGGAGNPGAPCMGSQHPCEQAPATRAAASRYSGRTTAIDHARGPICGDVPCSRYGGIPDQTDRSSGLWEPLGFVVAATSLAVLFLAWIRRRNGE